MGVIALQDRPGEGCVLVCGVEWGVEGIHLPRYYCQSIIQGNTSRTPQGRVHYALTSGSVLVTKPSLVIVCRDCVCIYACVRLHQN